MRRTLAALALVAAQTVGAPAWAGGWQTASGGGISTDVYVPDSQSPVGSGRSLLIVLHGCTQTGAALKQNGGFEPVSDELGVVVALPTVPNGGVYAGCWDYYGADHARSGRHDGPLLELTASLVGDASLGIDPDQVYVSGLSSGAGEAMVLGCLAPDVFAGVGIAAGPTVGTDASQIAFVSTSVPIAAQLCRSLAGSAASSFDTQLASIVYGDGDYIVAQGYGDVNAEAFATVYANGDALSESSFAVAELEGSMPAGDGTLWSDSTGPRVSKIRASGMGHAWPAGTGDGPELSFVAKKGVNYAHYLADFFSTNTRRASGGPASSGSSGGTSDGDGEPAKIRGESTADGGCATVPGSSGDAHLFAFVVAALIRIGARRNRTGLDT